MSEWLCSVFFFLFCLSFSDISGLQIIGNEKPIVVGETAILVCLFDLKNLALEWLKEDSVIISSNTSKAELCFNTVSDSLHLKEYTCRARTEHGTQQKTVTIHVEGSQKLYYYCCDYFAFIPLVPSHSLNVTVSSKNAPVAGHLYSVSCKANWNKGLTGSPSILWTGPNGAEVIDEGDIFVNKSEGIATIHFKPLHLLNNGSYMCTASIPSPALHFALNFSVRHDINVLISK